MHTTSPPSRAHKLFRAETEALSIAVTGAVNVAIADVRWRFRRVVIAEERRGAVIVHSHRFANHADSSN